MNRALVLALSILAPAAQDSTFKVRECLERMQDDDIDVADQAAADLVSLGQTALGVLREEFTRRGGDLRLRIEVVIGRIERAERMKKAVGTVPRVTVDVKDAPVAEVLALLEKRSGVKVEGVELPADLRVSLKAENEVLWKALDDLCRGDGGLMFQVGPRRVQIHRTPYRDLPRVFDKGFFFFVDGFTLNRYVGAGSRTQFSLQAAMVLPPGSTPLGAHLDLLEFEDDRGTNLLEAARRGFRGRQYGWSGGSAPSLIVPLYLHSSTPPDEAATAVARLKGRAILQFALKMKSVVTLAKPLAQTGTPAREGTFALLVKNSRRTGANVRFDLEVTHTYSTQTAEEEAAANWRVELRDAQGKMISGRADFRGASSSSSGNFTITETQRLGMTFEVPEGTEVASMEIIQPVDVVEMAIPFQFRDLPLR